jgi:hypothetical protein
VNRVAPIALAAIAVAVAGCAGLLPPDPERFPVLYSAIAMAKDPPFPRIPELYTAASDLGVYGVAQHATVGNYSKYLDWYTNLNREYNRQHAGYDTQYIYGLALISAPDAAKASWEGGEGHVIVSANLHRQPVPEFRRFTREFQRRYGPSRYDGSFPVWEGIVVELNSTRAGHAFAACLPEAPCMTRTRSEGRLDWPPGMTIPPRSARPTSRPGTRAVSAPSSGPPSPTSTAWSRTPSSRRLWRERLSRSLRTFVAQRQAWGRFEQSGMVAGLGEDLALNERQVRPRRSCQTLAGANEPYSPVSCPASATGG